MESEDSTPSVHDVSKIASLTQTCGCDLKKSEREIDASSSPGVTMEHDSAFTLHATRALRIRVKRAHGYTMTEENVLALANRFGGVEYLRIRDTKAYLLMKSPANAMSMLKFLKCSKSCDEMMGKRVFASLIATEKAKAPGHTLELIPNVDSATVPNVPGLSVFTDFISEDLESRILTHLDKCQRWDMGPAETTASRRTQHFGFAYNYKIQGADPSARLPGGVAAEVQEILDKLASTRLMHPTPDQVTLQEYTAGQGIPPHFDTVWAFGGQLGSVSLLAPTVMRFRPVFTVGVDPQAVFDVVMPPRSLVVLAGHARYHYTHSIPERKHDCIDGKVVPRARRLSLTFRTMLGARTAPPPDADPPPATTVSAASPPPAPS
eukprot:m.865008 g.865008  ORF g.865008 m.865008 type:complete len:378 (-) comp23548_c0_seq2:1863-2996(-)